VAEASLQKSLPLFNVIFGAFQFFILTRSLGQAKGTFCKRQPGSLCTRKSPTKQEHRRRRPRSRCQEVLSTGRTYPGVHHFQGDVLRHGAGHCKGRRAKRKWETLPLASQSAQVTSNISLVGKRRGQILHLVYNLITATQLIQVALQRSPKERKNKRSCSFLPLFRSPDSKPLKQQHPAVRPAT